ncbi:MAG: GNAT family N-acetyltransferase [Acidimicrobiia bacterium]|nr:GNAT family N-acetyltransferase [Acidimicrobiia bacterium]
MLIRLVDEPSRLLAGWFACEWPDYFAGRDLDEIASMFLPGPGGLPVTLVAVIGDETVCTVSLRDASTDHPDIPPPWVGGLYVVPEHRHRGIAMRLVTAAVERAGSLGYEWVHISIRRNPEAYLERGWKLIGSATEDDGRVLVLKTVT